MGTKFEGVDILDFLGQVVELHTQHYKEDFDVDKELIQKVALSGEPEERRLLWMSRPCGTYCFPLSWLRGFFIWCASSW